MNSDQHSPTTSDYRNVNNSIRRVLSAGNQPHPDSVSGRSAKLFNSPIYGRKAHDMLMSGENMANVDFIEAYFADVPRPYTFNELDNSELSRLIDLFGPDIMRANFLSANLVHAKQHLPLLSGGACALETWATRLLSKQLVTGNSELRRASLLKLLDNAPYYTHLTGAMMLGGQQPKQLMYDETFPWFMTIFDIGQNPQISEKQWNLEIVEKTTRDLYERIYAAIGRRASLITANPPEIVRLPFESLQLEKAGHLEQWYHQYINELPASFSRYIPKQYRYDQFIGAHVRYTYVGPQLLDLVKQAIREKSHPIDEVTIHVRTKQDDHLYEGRRINRILLQGLHDDDHDFLSKYANICNLAIYFWHQQHWQNNNAFVGFNDLSLHGNIVHDTINLQTGSNNDIKTEEELWDIINSPLRLCRNNIDQHLRYLDKYIEEVRIYEDITLALNQLKNNISKLLKKLDGGTACIQERKVIAEVISGLIRTSNNARPSVLITAEKIDSAFANADQNQLQKELSNISYRYGRRAKIANIQESQYMLNQFSEIISCHSLHNGIEVRLSEASVSIQLLLHALKEVIDEELQSYNDKVSQEQQLLAEAQKEYTQMLALIAHIDINSFDDTSTPPQLFPLRSNLLFCHAMQLSFDPHIARFIQDAEAIESSNLELREKRRLLVKASRQILTRIKHHLQHIMLGDQTSDALQNLTPYDPSFLNNRASETVPSSLE